MYVDFNKSRVTDHITTLSVWGIDPKGHFATTGLLKYHAPYTRNRTRISHIKLGIYIRVCGYVVRLAAYDFSVFEIIRKRTRIRMLCHN